MTKKNPWLMVLVAICVLSLAQIACVYDPHDPFQLPAAVRGGGWMATAEGKATVGFQLSCDADTGKASGQFQFNNHAGLAFHGVVDEVVEGCQVESWDDYALHGRYTPQPKTLGDPGDLTIMPPDDSGCITIELEGGMYGGESIDVCLDRGNITFWGWPAP